MSKKLTVVIVTYQSAEIIGLCLSKINSSKYEILLVDNNSSDRTLEIVAQFLPPENIIKVDKNLGFSRANNLALQRVKTEYALVLNPDAFIEEDAVERVLEVMQKNPKIAIAAGFPYTATIDEQGNFDQVHEIKLSPKVYKNPHDDFYSTGFITGAAMFLQMAVFRKIGFFDPNFFLYCEDNEICKRSVRKGYINALVKGVKFIHCGKKSHKPTFSENSYRVCWHREGWSKAYYTQAIHGVVVGKLKALRMTLKYSALLAHEYFSKNKVNQVLKYSLYGVLGYLVGLKAFDKNGHPRMIKR